VAYLGIQWIVHGVGVGVVNGTLDPLEGAAAGASNSVVTVEQANHAQSGSLTLTWLDSQLPRARWVSGSTNVPYSDTARPVISVFIAGNHVVTAERLVDNSCTYGITVSSSSDPVIGAFDLPRPGSYGQLAVSSMAACSAENAPTTGWMSVSKTVLRDQSLR
jgi:hypothetical protein